MIIGIDLGTTNSLAAIYKDGKPQMLKNSSGSNSTPSVISFGHDGKNIVGEDAKQRCIREADSTVFSVKKFMGLKYHQLVASKSFENMPYKVSEKDDEIYINVAGKKLSVPEISAEVLTKLKIDAENTLGTTIEKAVITCPAYFSDTQREATRRAGALAGLDVVKILSEPTAAALAYGFTLSDTKAKTIAVYDLGGGTFDISILKLENGSFSVLSTNGDTLLGGDDIDKRIVNWLVGLAKKDGMNLNAMLNDPIRKNNAMIALQRMRIAAEKAKIELSSKAEADIVLTDLVDKKSLVTKLTKDNLENIVHFVTDATFKCCDKALSDANVTISDLDDVILVGGSTKSPFVRAQVKAYFRGKCNTSINPDEAVALGAAIQADILSGNGNSKVQLIDVTPLTLGIWSNGDKFVPVIKRNTAIPTEKVVTFTTAKDNVNALTFPIVQGEKAKGSENTLVGKLIVSGIEKAKAGTPKIAVKFAIDVNGIVRVSATDTATGEVASIKLQKSAV